MSKEKNEALDQRNFHEDVTESYGDEITQPQDSGMGRLRFIGQWNQKKSKNCKQRDQQHHSQNDNAEVYAPVHASTRTAQICDRVRRLEREEEEWRGVENWSYVVLIVGSESSGIVGAYEPGKGILGVFIAGKIEAHELRM